MFLIGLLVFGAYVPALWLGFVWDDGALVVRNQQTHSLAEIPNFFLVDLWATAPVADGASGYYRPLMLASLALERAVFGLNPVAAHLQNLIWHVLATWACFVLSCRLVGAPRAVLVALVFGLHPVQVEAVVWIAARNDLMAAAFGLAALAVLARPVLSLPASLLAAIFVCMAGLSKESVVFLPLMLVCVDLILARRPALRRYVPVGLGLCSVLALRAAAGVGGATLPDGGQWMAFALQLPRLLLAYGSLLLAPFHSASAWSLEYLDVIPRWRWAVGLIGCGSIAALFTWGILGKRHRVLGGLLMAGLAVAPALISIADKGLLGERYLYLGLVGLGLALAASLPRPQTWQLCLLVASCVVGIQDRLPHWADDRVLWSRAVQLAPSPYSWVGLAHIELQSDRPVVAAGLLTRGLDHAVPNLEACPALVTAADRSGRSALAVQMGHWARTRGCSQSAPFGGRYVQALVVTREFSEANFVLSRAPRDPGGLLLEAEAALAILLDGRSRTAELARQAPDPALFERRVEMLVATARAWSE